MELPKYGKDVRIDRQLLSDVNSPVTDDFTGDTDDLNFVLYLMEDAVEDRESRTYVYIDRNSRKAIAFVSLACTTLMCQQDNGKVIEQYAPAILIDKFVVDSRFRHLPYAPDLEDVTLSQMIFYDVLEYAAEISRTVIGAKYVVLYSTPEARNFYLKCEIDEFSEFMVPSDDPRTADCIPMYSII